MKRLGSAYTLLLALAMATGGAPSYHPPTEAIAFSGQLLSGDNFHFSEYLGSKPIILNFWASWGHPCDAEAELLENIYQQKINSLIVISVNVQDPVEKARTFVDKHGLSYPVVLDGTAEVAWIYHVKYLPTTFFINSSGKIAAIHRGPLNAGQLNRYLKLLLETQVSDKD